MGIDDQDPARPRGTACPPESGDMTKQTGEGRGMDRSRPATRARGLMSRRPRLTMRAWRIVATILAMITAGLTAVWVLCGAPDRYGDLPLWFRQTAIVHLAVVIGWTIVGARLEKP